MHLASLTKAKWPPYRDPPLSINHQILFFKRCSHILEKGYPLLDALHMTGWDSTLKPTCDTIREHLSAGDAVHEAFTKANFSSSVTNFLYFSQVHHDLPRSFQQIQELLHMKKNYKERFFRVIRYPIFLFVFLIIACTILQKTVLPNYMLLFEGKEVGTIKLMLVTSHIMNGIGLLLLLSLCLLLIFVFALPRIPFKRKLFLYEKIPLLKIYHTYSISFLFTTHLHSLLQTGLPLKDAIELLESHKKYEVLSHYCSEILYELSNGKSFAQAVYRCRLFRPELTAIFHHTYDIEALKDEMELMAEFFMEFISQKITRWLHIIQPAFFIFIAAFIVLIYSSIMLPLYQWMNQL